MLSKTILSLMALRVLFCPILCMGSGDDVHATTMSHEYMHSCHCEATTAQSPAERSSDSQDDKDCPLPADCPCGESCVCHALLDASNKIRQQDMSWYFSHDLDLVSSEAVTGLMTWTYKLEFRSEVHPDLHNGKAIRVAIASLLL